MQVETGIEPDAVRIALVRQWARHHLAAAGLDARTLDVLVLLVSETVANSIVHAEAPRTLCIDVDSRRTRVEVRDGTRAHPVLRALEPTATGGRGIMFIDRLASRWGTVAHDEAVQGDPTKTVWFELEHGGVAPLSVS